MSYLLRPALDRMSTYPCHVSHSTTAYETQFAVFASVGLMDVECRLAKGWGNALVVVQGMVNIRWTGIPNACAQWICAKLGGLAMIASATNGSWVSGSSSMHDLQQPSSISATMTCFFLISPSRSVFICGIRPGFLTMYAMSCAGSPPMGKNSRYDSFTKFSKTLWVAMRTR